MHTSKPIWLKYVSKRFEIIVFLKWLQSVIDKLENLNLI